MLLKRLYDYFILPFILFRFLSLLGASKHAPNHIRQAKPQSKGTRVSFRAHVLRRSHSNPIHCYVAYSRLLQLAFERCRAQDLQPHRLDLLLDVANQLHSHIRL